MKASPLCAVSIHDVMPATLSQCEALFALCQTRGIRPVTLLIVPGQPWADDDLRRLRHMLAAGAVAAGHGWTHQIDTRQLRGLGPRLHSVLMSKDVGEHLLLDAAGIAALIARCYDWFSANALPAPTLYVPPAWAMGRISRAALQGLPFSQYEYFAGVYDSAQARFEPSPVVGFEAVSPWRAHVVGAWNRLARARAQRGGRWRISLHPQDLSLGLSAQLRRFLSEVEQPVDYTALMTTCLNPASVG